MRTRLAFATMLTLGALLSGAGAGLALSGPSGSGSAGVAQYGTPAGVISPTTVSNTGTTGTTSTPAAALQSTRQVSTQGNGTNLPFTGYAAIPVLLIGIGLLTLGVIMRRRFVRDHTSVPAP